MSGDSFTVVREVGSANGVEAWIRIHHEIHPLNTSGGVDGLRAGDATVKGGQPPGFIREN